MKLPLDFVEPTSCVPDAVADWLYAGLFPQKIGESAVVLLPSVFAVRAVKSLVLKTARKHGYSGMAGVVFVTPEIFTKPLPRGTRLASDYRSFCAWKSALNNYADDSGNPFPALPKNGNFSGIISELNSLVSDLSESGTNVASAAKHLEKKSDSERWKRLSALESLYTRALGDYVPKEKALDCVDCNSAFHRAYGEKAKIFLAGLPDPTPKLVGILDSLEDTPIKIGVVAPESWRDYFDSWGRPTNAWIGKNMDLDSDFIQISPVPDIRTQAELVADLISSYGSNPSETAAVCCGEGDSAPLLSAYLNFSGVDAYSLSGTRLADMPLTRLLSQISRFWEEGSFDNFDNIAAIIRNPLVLAMLMRITGSSPDDILSECDSFFDSHLPDTFESALTNAEDLPLRIFTSLEPLVHPSTRADAYFKNLISVLFPNPSEIDSGSAEFEELEFFKEQISDILSDEDLNMEVPDAVSVVLQLAQRRNIPPDGSSKPASMPLSDWVDIFWSNREHLVLCDFNDGIVPQNAPYPSSVIPDALRGSLGMRDSDSRRARDAYMLAVLAESRRDSGRISIIVPRRRGDATPAAPSCLLFQCRDGILAQRVEALFSRGADSGKSFPFKPSWTLKVPIKELKNTIPASALKTYIRNPFEFYLANVMDLRTFNENAVELPPDKLGNIVHSTLKEFGNGELKDSTDPRKVKDSLIKIMDSKIAKYGRDFSPVLSLQFRSLRERLGYAAKKLVKLKEDGWKTVFTEEKLEPLDIGGLKISIRVDRVDERPGENELLIIDYKTKDSLERPRDPRKDHMRKVNEEVEWTDLQLPLYVIALSKRYPEHLIKCAYFVIGSSEDGTGLALWGGEEGGGCISGEDLESALKKTGELCSKIREREFYPSAMSEWRGSYKTMFSFGGGFLRDHMEFSDV